MQEIGTDGGLFHYVFSGQYGKKVMPHVLEIGVVIYRKLSKLYVFILLLVCTKAFSDDTATFLDVLGSV